MAAKTPTPRIFVINCDPTKQEFIDDFGDVPHLFRNLFRDYLKGKDTAEVAADAGAETDGWKLQTCNEGAFYFKGFDSTKYKAPGYEHLKYPVVGKDQIDCVIVGGSAYSVRSYRHPEPGTDFEWLKHLAMFLALMAVYEPKVKLMGICFGHQLISHVLYENKVQSSSWEIGPSTILVDDDCRYLFPGGNPNIQMFHAEAALEDIVQDARGLVKKGMTSMMGRRTWGQTPDCGNQGTVVFYDGPDGKQIHVMTFQGHPELTKEMAARLLELFSAEGTKDEAVPKDEELKARKKMETFEFDDGARMIAAQAMWKVATGATFDKPDA